MSSNFDARWISRRRMNDLKKSQVSHQAVFLTHLNGFIVIEPQGSDLGDGPALSPEEVDYELQFAWINEPTNRLRRARELLGLEAPQMAGVGV
jgi:hypothetical protein